MFERPLRLAGRVGGFVHYNTEHTSGVYAARWWLKVLSPSPSVWCM
jgi:hypothetical protein